MIILQFTYHSTFLFTLLPLGIKKCVFSCVLTLKYMHQFGMNSKKNLTLQKKQKK
jgi:hypothetical protein